MLGCLRDTIPKLTRSVLHRCLVRHGISRLPQDKETSSKRKASRETKIGDVHIDSAQFRSAEGKGHMFLAINRVSKFVYVEFHPTAEMATDGAFMRHVIRAVPTRSTPCYRQRHRVHQERLNQLGRHALHVRSCL